MRKELVVARYKEPVINWLDDVPLDVDIILYNKGPLPDFDFCDAVLQRAARVATLPNVGREGQTYLQHIVWNYDNLADITFFSQGNPRPHVRGMSLADFFDFDDVTVPASKMKLASTGMSRSMTGWTLNSGPPEHIPHLQRPNSRWSSLPAALSFSEWWRTYVQLPIPDEKTVQFSWGGTFSVTKPYILSYSLDYYEQLLQTVSTHINPEEGHFLERAWSYIYSPNNE